MAEFFDALSDEHQRFIERQHVFFVATAAADAGESVAFENVSTAYLWVFEPYEMDHDDWSSAAADEDDGQRRDEWRRRQGAGPARWGGARGPVLTEFDGI